MKIYNKVASYGLYATLLLSIPVEASRQTNIPNSDDEMPPGWEFVVKNSKKSKYYWKFNPSALTSITEEAPTYTPNPTVFIPVWMIAPPPPPEPQIEKPYIKRRLAPLNREFFPYIKGKGKSAGHKYFSDFDYSHMYLDDEEGKPYPLDAKGLPYDPKIEVSQGVLKGAQSMRKDN